MKKLVLAVVVTLSTFGLTAPTFAQVTATTNSSANTASTAGATNAGNDQRITFNSSADGTTTLRTTPSMGGNSFYGSFSTDNCANSAGGTIAVPMVGFSGVGPVREEQCAMLRVYERTQQGAAVEQNINPERAVKFRQAASDILCMVSEKGYKAMANQGLCTLTFEGEKLNAATTKTAAVTPSVQKMEHLALNADGTTRPITELERKKKYWGNDNIVRRNIGLPPV